MRKYILLLLLFLFLFINSGESYSYVSCDVMVDLPNEVTTLNLENYLNKLDYKEIYYLCNYDYCYDVKSSNNKEIVESFTKLLNNKTSDDDMLITNVKGYSITKIGYNGCK